MICCNRQFYIGADIKPVPDRLRNQRSQYAGGKKLLVRVSKLGPKEMLELKRSLI